MLNNKVQQFVRIGVLRMASYSNGLLHNVTRIICIEASKAIKVCASGPLIRSNLLDARNSKHTFNREVLHVIQTQRP